MSEVKKKIQSPTKEEYLRAAFDLACGFAPRIYSCKKCGWPVARGYCCNFCGDSNPSEAAE